MNATVKCSQAWSIARECMSSASLRTGFLPAKALDNHCLGARRTRSWMAQQFAFMSTGRYQRLGTNLTTTMGDQPSVHWGILFFTTKAEILLWNLLMRIRSSAIWAVPRWFFSPVWESFR